MLPTHVLTPILDALGQLVSRYGATVVLCTATQPALDAGLGLYNLRDVREIVVPDPPGLFAQLKRVEYALPSPGFAGPGSAQPDDARTPTGAGDRQHTRERGGAAGDAPSGSEG